MQAAEHAVVAPSPPEPWLTAPNLLTLSRVPLAAALWLARGRPRAVLALMGLAGFTDLADGWLARRLRRRARPATPAGQQRGAWLDPVCDKVFVSSALGVAVAARHPPLGVAAAVLTRELLLALALATSQTLARRRPPHRFGTAPIGKLTTVAQYAAVAALLAGSRLVLPLALTAAVAGCGAAALYIGRELAPD